MVLERVSCIYYLVWFKKNKMQALIDLGSEVNTMTSTHAAKLGLKVKPTNFAAQKVDDSIFETFGIVLASFKVENKLSRSRFFQKSFLLADTSIDVLLEMSFLILSNANIRFAGKKLT